MYNKKIKIRNNLLTIYIRAMEIKLKNTIKIEKIVLLVE